MAVAVPPETNEQRVKGCFPFGRDKLWYPLAGRNEQRGGQIGRALSSETVVVRFQRDDKPFPCLTFTGTRDWLSGPGWDTSQPQDIAVFTDLVAEWRRRVVASRPIDLFRGPESDAADPSAVSILSLLSSSSFIAIDALRNVADASVRSLQTVGALPPIFEPLYADVAKWFGGSEQHISAQRTGLQRWAGTGAAGAAWLVNKLSWETNADFLSAAPLILASIGVAAYEPILEGLQADRGAVSTDRAEALIRALEYLPRPVGTIEQRIGDLLADYRESTHEDLREAASEALEQWGAI